MVDYTTLSIPSDLVERAERVMKGHGYASVTEFSKDAIRRRVEELEELERMENKKKATKE